MSLIQCSLISAGIRLGPQRVLIYFRVSMWLSLKLGEKLIIFCFLTEPKLGKNKTYFRLINMPFYFYLLNFSLQDTKPKRFHFALGLLKISLINKNKCRYTPKLCLELKKNSKCFILKMAKWNFNFFFYFVQLDDLTNLVWTHK